MGPHGVPRSCQLSSQSCNGGSLEAQLSDRPADHPHTHTRPRPCASHHTPRTASTAITGLSVEHQTTLTPSEKNQMETLQTNEQMTPTTTTKQHRAAADRVRHRPRPLTTAEVEVRSSSRTATHKSRTTPRHQHSIRKKHQNRCGLRIGHRTYDEAPKRKNVQRR